MKCSYMFKLLCGAVASPFKPTYFQLDNRTYPYFNNIYNTTFLNERTVEVPIIQRYVVHELDHNILEVGNVLNYYFGCLHHDVIDRNELGTDLFKITSRKKYKLIVSISTVEHIEEQREAFKVIKGLLAPGGKAVITIPVGFNNLEYAEYTNIFTELLFMRRVSWSNKWEQGDYCGTAYASRYPFANEIMIGVIK